MLIIMKEPKIKSIQSKIQVNKVILMKIQWLHKYQSYFCGGEARRIKKLNWLDKAAGGIIEEKLKYY